jgi:predicted RNase H-like HicB family nuclease
MKTTATASSPVRRYLVKIWYEEPDACFIASAPALVGCVTYGATFAEAARHIEEAVEAWLATAEGEGLPIPEPDLAAEELEAVRPIVSVAKLARVAGINQHTLAAKIRRGTPFSPEEARGILAVLRHVRPPASRSKRRRVSTSA